MKTKTYLGDGVYVEFDAFGGLVLTTENGISVTNRIVFEPEVFAALIAFAFKPEVYEAMIRAQR